MGFFDYIMKGIGFEPVESAKAQKVDKQDVVQTVNNAQTTSQVFSLPVFNQAISQGNAQASQDSNQNIIVYNPKNQTDIKNLVDFLRRKEPIIVNFGELPTDIASTMIAFLTGSLYALKGSIHPIANNLYLLTPEGVNILQPKQN